MIAEQYLGRSQLYRRLKNGSHGPLIERYAARLASNGPLALRKVKEAVLRSSGATLVEAFEIESACGAEVWRSEDAREGPRAFVEKRPPRFSGR